MKKIYIVNIFAIILHILYTKNVIAKIEKPEKPLQEEVPSYNDSSFKRFFKPSSEKSEIKFERQVLEEGDSMVYIKENGVITDVYVKKGEYKYYFEHSILLSEMQKIPTWKDEMANEEFGRPIPESSYDKFSKISLSSYFQITHPNKKRFYFISLTGSTTDEKVVSYTVLEDINFGFKYRILRTYGGKFLFFYLVKTSYIKNYDGLNEEGEAMFSNFKNIENHLILEYRPRTEIPLLEDLLADLTIKKDFGYYIRRSNSIQKEAILLNLSITKKINEKVFLIAESEVSTLLYDGKFENKNPTSKENFKRYGTYFIKFGLMFEVQKDEFFALKIVKEKSFSYAYTKEELSISYITKF